MPLVKSAQSCFMAVGFSGLKMRCLIGILPQEQIEPQDILVSLKVRLPQLPESEEISATIDYTELAKTCENVALSRHFPLLETLAAEMLDAVCDQFSCVHGWIRIEKPAALERAPFAFVEYEKGV